MVSSLDFLSKKIKKVRHQCFQFSPYISSAFAHHRIAAHHTKINNSLFLQTHQITFQFYYHYTKYHPLTTMSTNPPSSPREDSTIFHFTFHIFHSASGGLPPSPPQADHRPNHLKASPFSVKIRAHFCAYLVFFRIFLFFSDFFQFPPLIPTFSEFFRIIWNYFAFFQLFLIYSATGGLHPLCASVPLPLCPFFTLFFNFFSSLLQIFYLKTCCYPGF